MVNETKGREMPEQSLQSVIALSGFALAHAAWSVCDGETLCTMAVTENQSDRELIRFEANSLSDSIDEAREHLTGLQDGIDRWVLVFDGYLTLKTEKRDALVMQVWSKQGGTPQRIIQLYQAKAFFRRFKILGAPKFVDESGALYENRMYQNWMLDGISQHTKVVKLWEKWYTEN
jgi:hypothetical protein